MNWEAFTPWSALLGGVLIGGATGLALLLNGKIAGVSGIVARILRPVAGDTAWRVWFVLGLFTSGLVVFALYPKLGDVRYGTGLFGTGAAGLLVGIGTRLGGGCTSGHGVCGISRGCSAASCPARDEAPG